MPAPAAGPQEREAATSLREAKLREELGAWAAERAVAAEQDAEARRKADKELSVSCMRACSACVC